MPKKAQGTACSGAAECTTGLCVDNVCCDRACGGTCEACRGLGADGTCSSSPLIKGVDVPVPSTDQSLGLQVIWADTQYALSSLQGLKANVSMVSSTGTVTGTATVTLSQASDPPSLAWSGLEFVLGWTSYADASAGPTTTYLQRIGSGATLVGSPLMQQTSASRVIFRDVAWSAARSEYGLLTTGSSGMTSTRANVSAMPLPGSLVSMATAWSGTPAIVARADGTYGAAYSAGGTVFLARLDGTGTRIGSEVTVGSGFSEQIAWSGSEFGIPYIGPTRDLKLARFDAGGTRQGFDVALAGQEVYSAWATWAGDRWLVVWSQGSPAEVYGRFVSAQGSPLGTATRLTTTATQTDFPRAAWSGQGFGLTRYEIDTSTATWTWAGYFSRLSCD